MYLAVPASGVPKQWTDDIDTRNHGGFLWIKGKPGCGKSTIIKGALESIKAKLDHEVMPSRANTLEVSLSY